MRNEDEGPNCFVCGKALPVAGVARSSARLPTARVSGTTARPQQRVQLGSVGDRLIALMFDRIVIVAALLVPLGFFAPDWIGAGPPLTPVWSWILGSTVLLLVIFLYHFILESTSGTTAGKLIMGLRIVNEGDRSGAAAIALRNLLRFVDGIALYLVGFLVALFDSKVRRVGDIAGGTIVVQTRLRPGERAALLLTFLGFVGGALWLSHFFCPECPAALETALRSLVARLVL